MNYAEVSFCFYMGHSLSSFTVKSGIMNLSEIYIEHKRGSIPSVATTLLLGGAFGPFETLQLVFCTEPRLHGCESGKCSFVPFFCF